MLLVWKNHRDRPCAEIRRQAILYATTRNEVGRASKKIRCPATQGCRAKGQEGKAGSGTSKAGIGRVVFTAFWEEETAKYAKGV